MINISFLIFGFKWSHWYSSSEIVLNLDRIPQSSFLQKNTESAMKISFYNVLIELYTMSSDQTAYVCIFYVNFRFF